MLGGRLPSTRSTTDFRARSGRYRASEPQDFRIPWCRYKKKERKMWFTLCASAATHSLPGCVSRVLTLWSLSIPTATTTRNGEDCRRGEFNPQDVSSPRTEGPISRLLLARCGY